MKHRILGRTGIKVSEIGMGLEHLLDKDESVVTSTIRAAIDGGVTYFDCHPGHDHKNDTIEYIGYDKLGRALGGDRGKMCLTYLATASRSPAETQPRYEYFLKALNTDYIDIFILQFCDKIKDYEHMTTGGGLLDYALKLKAEGKIKHIGISTHSSAVAFRAIDSGVIDVLMYPVNPAFDVVTDEDQYKTDKLDTLWDAAHDFSADGKAGAQPRKSVYSECERAGVGLVVMKAFGGGFIFRVEKDAGFTPVNLISYALAQTGVSTVAPGCTKPEEILEILTYNTSTDEERDYSAAVAKSRWSVIENCLYCNHCLPCTADINIGEVNRLLDALAYHPDADIGSVKAKYDALPVKASACTQCGICVERCPFRVKVIDRMEQAVATFE